MLLLLLEHWVIPGDAHWYLLLLLHRWILLRLWRSLRMQLRIRIQCIEGSPIVSRRNPLWSACMGQTWHLVLRRGLLHDGGFHALGELSQETFICYTPDIMETN
jgi:hypothetical protein